MEILLQKRLGKTWRGWHDISAAGHVDLGEDPLAAAIREVQEETSLIIEPGALWFAGVHRFSGAARPDGSGVKNELRFLYLLEVPGEAELAPSEGEVDSFKWLPLSIFKNEVTQKQGARNQARKYVPLGEDYFAMLIKSLETMNSGAVTD